MFLSLCARLGPLASFESLLSMHGEDVSIFNDMLVAVEDLRGVEFTLILVDKRTRVRTKKESNGGSGSGSGSGSGNGNTAVQLLQYHSFPLPRVTGSRSGLKVMLPVPDYVYTMLPLEQVRIHCTQRKEKKRKLLKVAALSKSFWKVVLAQIRLEAVMNHWLFPNILINFHLN